MAVVKVQRYVLRGKIRAQVQYAVLLGNRIIKAANTNAGLDLFAPPPLPASQSNFVSLVAHWQAALLEKDS